ncbi:hypothetical protein [Winogradskyella sp.]|uniref:hypothetical protein n=1 Tax=Winogradskyella sp. TaxID=1883156 RepID=UPI0026205763|nr:hypothetical protein [Winogradskyella sp.]
MAPIKFEEQLKEKLEKRNLQPSADGWARLSDRLDAEDNRSKKPWLGWLSIAAGIIILLAITVRIFGAKDIQETIPEMVEEEAIENVNKSQLPISSENESIELVAEDVIIDTETEDNDTQRTPQIINYKPVSQDRINTQLADNTTNDGSKPEEVIENTNKVPKAIGDEAIINKEAVASMLNELKAEKNSAIDREVDSLLKLASKELVRDKLLKDTSKAVDAQSLLEDVEDEMGQSFRSKVYEALKEGYETVKTAVAQRNN